MSEPRHTPVLVSECLGALAPRPGEVYADLTAGLGGHAAAVAPFLGPKGAVAMFDLDPANLARAAQRVRETPDAPRVVACHASFAEAPRLLAAKGLRADLVLADLGFSSNQMEDSERGLSFMRDGPLDMRLNPESPITAAELVNSLEVRELAHLIREYGEEPSARRIAEKLDLERRSRPISTTGRLAEILRAVVPHRRGSKGDGGGIDPATRTFQALRIAVNDELGSLERLLEAIKRGAQSSGSWLAPGARVAVISFHSLEDRPVKRAFGALVELGLAEHVLRKPVSASEEEIAANPRCRSAKLRAMRLRPGAQA